MKTLNKKSATIFSLLIAGLEDYNDVNRFDTGGESIMPVTVELIGKTKYGYIFSIAHYYKQHGDLMRDPEMTFLCSAPDSITPLSYQQDNLGIYQESVFQQEGGSWKYRPALQREHAMFANKWLQNIKRQQNLNKKTEAA